MSLTRKLDPRHFSTVYGYTVDKVKDFIEKDILKGEDKPWTLTVNLDENDTRPMVLVLDKDPMTLSYWRLPITIVADDELKCEPVLTVVHYLTVIDDDDARQQYYDRLALSITTVRANPFLFAFKVSNGTVVNGYYILENGITTFHTDFVLPFYTEPFEIKIPLNVKDKVGLNRFESKGRSLDILSDPIKGNFKIRIREYKILNDITIPKKTTAKLGIKPIKCDEISKESYFNIYPDNEQEVVRHVDGVGRILIKLMNERDKHDKLLKKITSYIDSQVILPRWFD